MRITQILADRLGWPEMTAEVAQIYNRLSAEKSGVRDWRPQLRRSGGH